MPDSIGGRPITVRREDLTKSQKKLLDFFTKTDRQGLALMTITDLANEAGVAESTVLRFCRVLGYNGYHEFRLNLAQGDSGLEARIRSEGLEYAESIADAYETAMINCRKILTRERLQAVYNMIFEAEAVCCFGLGYSYLAALEMHNRLMTMGILTYCEQDPHLQNVLISSRSEKDLLIIFSVSGSTKDTVEAAELARACGMKVLVITCGEKSPLTQFADLVLAVPPVGKGSRPGDMTGKVSQLFLADVICTGIHLSDKSRFDGFVARSSRATVSKLI